MVASSNVDGFDAAAQLKPNTAPASLAGRKPGSFWERNLVHEAMGIMDNLIDPIFWNQLSGMIFLGHF